MKSSAQDEKFSKIKSKSCALKKIHSIYGVEILLETGHKPLSYLQTAKVLNPRIMHWAMRLQPHRFRIVTIRGQDKMGADYLSR